jgi:hypothetical protein
MGVSDEKKTGLGFVRTCGWLALLAALGSSLAAAAPSFGNQARSTRDALDAGLTFVLCFGVFGAVTDQRPGLARIVLGLYLIAWVVFRPSAEQVRMGGGEGARIRGCYSNQKTLVGAIEMYNLDKNTKRAPLDAAFFAALKSGGYLQSIPDDPGQGPGSSGHYRITSAGNGITCEIHGRIQE